MFYVRRNVPMFISFEKVKMHSFVGVLRTVVCWGLIISDVTGYRSDGQVSIPGRWWDFFYHFVVTVLGPTQLLVL